MMVIVEGGSNSSVLEFNIRGKWCVLTAPQHHCLLWRGDVLHRGTGYSTTNVRLFAYVDSVLHLRKRDSVFEVQRQRKSVRRLAKMPEAKGSNRKRKLSGEAVGGWKRTGTG